MEEFKLDELKEAVHKYTYDVLYRLKIMDCAPDMVQIGNEIRSGMLFPDGAVPQYRQLAALVMRESELSGSCSRRQRS